MKDWLGTFHFLRPEWLWTLVSVPILYIAYRARDDVRTQWNQVIEANLLDCLLVSHRRMWRFRPIHMIFALPSETVPPLTCSRRFKGQILTKCAPIIIGISRPQTNNYGSSDVRLVARLVMVPQPKT